MTPEPAGVAPRFARHFLAVLPDDIARGQLVRITEGAQGRAVLAADLHLTLAFLGELRAPSPEALLDAVAAACSRPPLTLALDRVEAWPGPRALCAVGEAPEAAALSAQLWACLASLGYRPEPRPFKAHVTLARQLTPEACRAAPRPLSPPIGWTATRLHLLASAPAGAAPGQPRYLSRASRPLGSG